MLQPLIFLIVAALILFLVLGWAFALVKKVGGCLVHLLLLAAGLILLVYLGSLYLQRVGLI